MWAGCNTRTPSGIEATETAESVAQERTGSTRAETPGGLPCLCFSNRGRRGSGNTRPVPSRRTTARSVGLNPGIRRLPTKQTSPSRDRGLPQIHHLDGNHETMATLTMHSISHGSPYNTLRNVLFQIRDTYMESDELRYHQCHHSSETKPNGLIMSGPLCRDTHTAGREFNGAMLKTAGFRR